MQILGIFSFIGDSAKEMLVGLFLLIDSLVYSLISWLYQIFCILASFRLFDNSMFEVITSGIFSIIGVVALFLIAYQLLQYMINPDTIKSGEAIKKIILKIITSVLMVVLIPTIFDFFFDFLRISTSCFAIVLPLSRCNKIIQVFILLKEIYEDSLQLCQLFK